MKINKLNPHEVSDFRSLVEIFKEVFEIGEPIADSGHLEKMLSNPGFLVFVVRHERRVIGGLTIYVLSRYFSSRPIAYIYDVAIATEFQGQGFGKLLMTEVGIYCRDHGFEEAYVEAESDDTDAVNFYRKTNCSSEMNAVHFTYSFGGHKTT